MLLVYSNSILLLVSVCLNKLSNFSCGEYNNVLNSFEFNFESMVNAVGSFIKYHV